MCNFGFLVDVVDLVRDGEVRVSLETVSKDALIHPKSYLSIHSPSYSAACPNLSQ